MVTEIKQTMTGMEKRTYPGITQECLVTVSLKATETVFMAFDTLLISVDRSVPASAGKRECHPSQAPHPPVPAAAQGDSSSPPGTAQ